MSSIPRAVTRTVAATAILAGVAACSDHFLNVLNPNVIDAGTVDPTADATTLANSAQQNYAVAYGWMIMYSSWISGETLVAETFPTRNEFGRRDISDLNGSLNTDLWQPISLAAASTKIVLDLSLPTPTTNLNYARAATFRGYSFLSMATDFCSGTVSSGPELTTNQMLDSAVFWFGKAMDLGNANASSDGKVLASTALAGRARANLQRGNKTAAAADAAAVPAGFVFSINYTDDLNNRTRLGNRMWQYTSDRGSISIAPAYRVSDPRMLFKAPGQHNLTPQDPSSGPFFIEQKYPGFGSPIRLASKLEADYIAAEASGDPVRQLAFINAQRAANQQAAYSGPTDANSVLTELMNQRGLEFHLEGRRLADFRRNPNNVTNVPVAGSAYLKPGFAPVGSNSCYPIPRPEKDNNPNFPHA
jgi:hypothetical protein